MTCWRPCASRSRSWPRSAPAARGRGGLDNQPLFNRRDHGQAGGPIYCASKHAIIGLTRALAVAYAAANVRINALCPGPIDTPMLRGVASGDFEEMLPQYLASCPAARVGHAEEVAAAAVFLASDESRFLTGAAIPVDGGKAAGSMPADRYRLDFKIRR